ncbi:protein-glutamine glutaminase family protein [Bacteriovoracaceae bacterium]|nr:protein-glutamine glutaminase family protein [Bacteriovoracaceae bacterium]
MNTSLKNLSNCLLIALSIITVQSTKAQFYYSPEKDLTDYRSFPYYTDQRIAEYENMISPIENSNPTNFATMEQVMTLFNHLLPSSQKSQCYNRAYAWTYQMVTTFLYNAEKKDLQTKEYVEKNKLKGYSPIETRKMLIYYTKKYRDNLDDKWAFHIAPSVMLNGEILVLDKEFLEKPETVQGWVDDLIKIDRKRLSKLHEKLFSDKDKMDKKHAKLTKEYIAKKDSFIGDRILRIRKKIKENNEKINSLNLKKEEVPKIDCAWINHLPQWDHYPKQEWCMLQEADMFVKNTKMLRRLSYDNTPIKREWSHYILSEARKDVYKDWKDRWPTKKMLEKRKRKENRKRKRDERRQRRAQDRLDYSF